MINKKIQLKNFMFRNITAIINIFFPIKPKVVFSSFYGKQYSCNPRAISDYLHKFYPEYEIVWLLKDRKDPYHVIPDYVRIVTPSDGFYSQGREIASAFCYIYNCELEPHVSKKRKQLFIQTFHGDRGFKKILHDRYIDGKRPVPVYDNRITDICMSGSDFGSAVYRSAFRYSGEILQMGTARNEKLLQMSYDEKKELRKKLGIGDDTKVLLYAPTFRDAINGKQASYVDISRTIEVLEEKGESWMCLIRAHLASQGINVSWKNSKWIDITEYPDMTDILGITDMLITDYSSCGCDFILTGKPVILATFDSEEYTSSSREFKVTPQEAGFFTANSQTELEEIIRCKTHEDYEKCYQEIEAFFGTTETGMATETICKRIHTFYQEKYIH